MRSFLAMALACWSCAAFAIAATEPPPLASWQQLREQGQQAADTGHYKQAAELFEQAARAAKSQRVRDDTVLVELLDNTADTQRELEHAAVADALYRRVLRVREKTRGADSLLAGIAWSDIGQTWSVEDPEQARPALERALKIFEALPDPDPGYRATVLHNLASLDFADHHYPQAEKRWREVLVLRHKLHGEKSTQVATTLYNLGMLAATQSRYAEGIALFERSLAAYESAEGPDHSDVAICLVALADRDYCDGEHCAATAIPRLERATRILLRAFGPADSRLRDAQEMLAGDYEETHRYNDAITLRLGLLARAADDKFEAYKQHDTLADDFEEVGDAKNAALHRAAASRLFPDEND